MSDTKSKRCSSLMVLSTARSNTILEGSPTHVLNIRKGCQKHKQHSNYLLRLYNNTVHVLDHLSYMHTIKGRFETFFLVVNEKIRDFNIQSDSYVYTHIQLSSFYYGKKHKNVNKFAALQYTFTIEKRSMCAWRNIFTALSAFKHSTWTSLHVLKVLCTALTLNLLK